MSVRVAAFYKFARIGDAPELKQDLAQKGASLGFKGTILIAPEGINATISARAEALEAFLAALKADARFQDLTVKLSDAPSHPFGKFKVRLKREIITLGVPEADPAKHVGTYVRPEDWNGLISDPSVLVLDTRNDYEVEIGTFARAENPKTASFGEFPDYVRKNLDPKRHTRVAMFCTGGIRCEKASALLLSQGFPEVYHLEGGILKYLETVAMEESLWQGACFVFDERVALGHGVAIGHHAMCRSCGRAVERDAAGAPSSCLRCSAIGQP